MSKHHTEAEIAAALEHYHGLVHLAAQSLDLTPQAIYKRIKGSENLAEICRSHRGRLFETAFLQLESLVRSGNWAAVKQALGMAKEWGFMTGEEMKIDGCVPQRSEKELDEALLRALRLLAAGREGGAFGPGDILPPGFPPPA
jgi:hypothetical protein